MRALSDWEVQNVSGGGLADSPIEKHKIEAGGATGLASAIGVGALGKGWGAMTVATAFGAAPIAVIAIAGLAGYAQSNRECHERYYDQLATKPSCSIYHAPYSDTDRYFCGGYACFRGRVETRTGI